ncbi:609_t:CDS:1, partial [Dentiscutata heterogama]
MSKKKRIAIDTQLKEHPNTFRIDDNVLVCEYCNEAIEWKSKST